jgi:hypothetical protein
MQRVHVLTLFACLFIASYASIPMAEAAIAPAVGPLLVFSHDLIRPKQQVSDDPLDGLPTGDSDGRGHRKGGGNVRAACAVKVNAANDRDIGDLRATLAFVKHGPTSWPCPARVAPADIRLRISIDGDGKITACELVAGDASVASAMAKKLTGKSIARRPEGATAGIVVLTFASSR